MKKYITDERTGLNYELVGDYYLTLQQIIHRIDMQQIIRFLTIHAWEERIRIIGIGCNLQI